MLGRGYFGQRVGEDSDGRDSGGEGGAKGDAGDAAGDAGDTAGEQDDALAADDADATVSGGAVADDLAVIEGETDAATADAVAAEPAA